MKNIKMLVALLAALCLVLAVGCSKPAAPAAAGTPTVDKIKAAGKLIMLTNAGFAPYEFLGADNSVTGVDVEIAQAIAESLGVKLEIVDMDFDSIVFAVQSGKGDLGVAGMTNTEERQKTVDFSINYVDTVQKIIVPEGSTITGPADLAGKTIGVQMGTTGDLFATDEVEGANVQRYKTGPDAGAELAAGKLDAVVIDAAPAAQIAGANAGLVLLDTPATAEPEQYAIAMAKGKEDLKAVVDSVLEKLIAEGKIQAWLDEYNEIALAQ
ncbi:MAG: transporter substrate-binding domain-containing protein [Christensenellaceae bacterium]|jgi:polar amino acid transport system substrate-binding protein|nr:transporter substrate-binding domain-containing protein [Christensenellaceae bacterium]